MSAAAQWENPEGTLLATFQVNHSKYENNWEEYAILAQDEATVNEAPTRVFSSPFAVPSAVRRDENGNVIPGGPVPFEFDSRGVFMSGTLAQSTDAWLGDPGDARVGGRTNGFGGNNAYFCYGWSAPNCPTTRGLPISNETRAVFTENTITDYAGNLKWTLTDKLQLGFDVQYVKSDTYTFDNSRNTQTYGDVYIEIRGDRPYVEFFDPSGIAQEAGGFANPANYHNEWTMEHINGGEGEMLAFRADAEYALDQTWFSSIKAGVRRSDREQVYDWSTYNWGSITPMWGYGPAAGVFLDDAPWNNQNWQYYALNSGIAGGGITPNRTFIFPDFQQVSNYQQIIDTYDGNSNSWVPLGDRPNVVPGTIFLPSERIDVTETVDAAYLMLKFGGPEADLFGMNIRGNVGLRYVKTEVESGGGIVFPLYIVPPPPPPPLPGQPTRTDYRALTPAADIAFQNGGDAPSTATASNDIVLPSFNVRVEVAPDMFVRFAASRAISRPDMGLYRNFTSIGVKGAPAGVTYDPPGDVNGEPVSYTPQYEGSTGNPAIKPVVADQFDLTYEWYFSDTGNFTVAVFKKEFSDYIQNGTYLRQFTNNGVTRTVEVTGPVNGDGASIQGFELGGQTFFDFLPGPFDGLGVQANYTYIENKGISNANVNANQGGVSNQDVFTGLPLEGLSEKAYNLVGLYEKGPLALRLAYNWRSEHLVTQRDCCIALPVWQDDYGQLDGSIRYRVSDRLEVSLQGQNLTNSETVLYQQVTQGKLLLPYSVFYNDRKVQIGLRYRM